MKLVASGSAACRIHLVDRKEERLAGADSRRASSRSGAASSVRPSTTMTIASASSSATLRLAKDFRRDEVFVVGKNAARINDAQLAAAPFGLAIETVARDAGLIAHNGAARADQPVEQRGFADVGAAHDGDGRHAGSGRSRR